MRERSAARKRRLNRRDALAVVAGALPYVWIPGAAARQQVVVRTSGGGYDEARKAAVYDAFRKETGIDVVLVAANATKLLALAKTGGGGIDVIDTDDDTLIQIDRAGGLEPIDYAGFKYTDINDLPAAVRRARYVGHSYFATILGYNTRTYPTGKEPRSWAEYWDTKRYPGPRALPSAAIGEPTLEFALLADGVPMDKLYPLDIARAFRKLGTIRPSIVTFWETGALSAQLLSDNEAALAAIWNTRLYEAKAKGAPVGAQWNQNQGGLVAFGISKGTRNLDAAKRFVDFSLSGATQLRWMRTHAAIPANRKALPAVARELVDPATGQLLVQSKGFMRDVGWWANNKKRVSDYWAQWILEK